MPSRTFLCGAPHADVCGDLLNVVPVGCKGTTCPTVGLSWTAGICCSAPGAPLVFLLHWPLGLLGCFSPISHPPLPAAVVQFFPFFNLLSHRYNQNSSCLSSAQQRVPFGAAEAGSGMPQGTVGLCSGATPAVPCSVSFVSPAHQHNTTYCRAEFCLHQCKTRFRHEGSVGLQAGGAESQNITWQRAQLWLVRDHQVEGVKYSWARQWQEITEDTASYNKCFFLRRGRHSQFYLLLSSFH